MINKKPNFLNDSGVASFLVVLLFAFILATTSIAYFMGQIYGISVIAPELHTSDLRIEYDSIQNFKSCDAELDTMKKSINSGWNYTCGVGMVLTDVYMNPQTNSYGYFLIKNLQPDANGIYQNTYTINNTATNIFGKHENYCVVLRYTGGLGHNEVCVSDTGIYVPIYGANLRMYLGNNHFFPFPNANQDTSVVIKTIYDDKNSKLTMYFDNNLIFDNIDVNSDLNVFGWFDRHYGGVASFTKGFTLEDFNTEGTIISGVNDVGGLSELVGFLLTIWKLATFSLPSTIPFPHQISFIFDILVAGIFICIVVIWRGSA